MTATWSLRPHDSDQIRALSRDSGLPPLVAHLLLNRGVTTPEAAKLYLGARRDSLHDPAFLPGVVEAAGRIVAAIRDDRRIVIYGDYDVDGACGTSILWTCLKLAGAKDVEFYIPHRVDEGYGLNADALRMLAVERKASMIVTVDCGVTAVKEALLARELGVELVVTDHHHVGDEWPEALVVHPRKPGGVVYPFPELCGAAVAFKLAWQICKSFGDGKKASPALRGFLVRSLNLVALATVADVMPLEGENRVFVRHGLRAMVDDSASVGLKALLQVCNFGARDRLSAYNLSFGMAPRINAAGRLRHADAAVKLLTTHDAAEALELAKSLDDCNKERQEIERSIVAEARRMVDAAGDTGDRGAIVVAKEGWHPGVVGIVAARLVDAYHRPAIVIALNGGDGAGSGRTVPGFDLHAAISACSEGLLRSFGGHKAAAGLKIATESVAEFAERFDRHCRSALTPEMRLKRLDIDAEVPLGSLTLPVVQAIDDLEPYGIGNPQPVLLAERVHVVADPKIMGANQNHLSFRVGQGDVSLRAVAWNMAARAPEIRRGIPISVVFRPSINEWNGRRDVQLEVKDFRIAEGEESRHARPA